MTDGWVSSLMTTVKGGAPKRPSDSTSHPSRSSIAVRAAARHVKLAMVAPLTKAAPQPAGMSSSSTSQRCATSSRREAMGLVGKRTAFWSHAPASQLAASAAGRQPPCTNPKKRPPALATVAGDPMRSRRSNTASGSAGPSARGSSKTVKQSNACREGATGRPSSPRRYRFACTATWDNRSAIRPGY